MKSNRHFVRTSIGATDTCWLNLRIFERQHPLTMTITIRFFSFILIGASAATAISAYGQSNTFPSSGNVGIGTTSPGIALEVNGNIAAGTYDNSRVQITGGGGPNSISEYYSAEGNPRWQIGRDLISSGQAGIGFGIGGAMSYVGTNSSGNTLQFYTNGLNQRMTINSAGSVGIGTTSPGALLDVNGSGSYEGGLTVGNTSSIGINNGLILGTAAKGTSPSGGQGAIQICSNDGSNQLQGIMSLITDPTGSNRRLVIEAIEQGVAFRNVILAQDGGNVGIGTTDPTYPLSVNGTVEAKEVIVQTGWSDYVFDPHYHLAPLSEVERAIKDQNHLPGMPSAKEVAEHGVKMGEMEAKLLAKIEELTLHQIDQEKHIERLDDEINELRRK
jgi:hypothetical protein